MYYVADANNQPRLYREFHRLAVGDGPGAAVSAAVEEMLAGAPRDPDYTSPWPKGDQVLGVSVDGTTATVNLSAFVALGAAYENAAVQQLVHTVTAADPRIKAVRVRIDGAVPPSGHADWTDPVRRAPALDVFAQVWILAPDQGATTSSPVRVHVYGTGFEGHNTLQVYRDGTKVADTYVTTMMGNFAEAETTIALPSGTYELRAYTDSGEDGSLFLWDTKTFTVGR